MKLIFAVLCLVVVSNEGLAEKCEKDSINQCLKKLDDVVEKSPHTLEQGKNLDNYCKTVEPVPECLKHISESCKADFPYISISMSIALLYKNEFCGENGKMYMKVAPCLTANNALFKKCELKQVSPEKKMCEFVDYMLCAAKFSKENCKEHGGVGYGNALEERMKMKKGMCSGAGCLANSFWTFAITVFSVLLIRNKLQ